MAKRKKAGKPAAAPKGRPRKLTDKQRRFCQEYVIVLDATEAARRAKYSEKTAGQQGWQLLQNPLVAAHIAELQAKRAQRMEITADRVLEELGKIGFSDMRNYLTWGPEGIDLKPSDELTPDQAAAVVEVSKSAEGVMRFKLHDKLSALDKIGRHLGMFVDRTELTGKDGKDLGIVSFDQAIELIAQSKKPADTSVDTPIGHDGDDT